MGRGEAGGLAGLAPCKQLSQVDFVRAQLASCLPANSRLALHSCLMMPRLSLLANDRTKLPRDSLNCHQQVWDQPHRSQNQGEQSRSEQVRTNRGPRHALLSTVPTSEPLGPHLERLPVLATLTHLPFQNRNLQLTTKFLLLSSIKVLLSPSISMALDTTDRHLFPKWPLTIWSGR